MESEMSDLIDRAAAIYIASGYCHPANIAKELAKLPSAQPEVIRCKDCARWCTKLAPCSVDGKACWCEYIEMDTYEDEYCSWAERREDE